MMLTLRIYARNDVSIQTSLTQNRLNHISYWSCYFIISSAFHAGREDPTSLLRVFAEYASSPPWIAAHIGQFVGDILIFAGGFVTLFRVFVQSESMTVSGLAWIGLTVAIIAA